MRDRTTNEWTNVFSVSSWLCQFEETKALLHLPPSLDDGWRGMKSFLSWIEPSSASRHLLSISAFHPAADLRAETFLNPDIDCY